MGHTLIQRLFDKIVNYPRIQRHTERQIIIEGDREREGREKEEGGGGGGQ